VERLGAIGPQLRVGRVGRYNGMYTRCSG